MALQSALLAGNARLDEAAAGGPSVKKAPPADDPDAVKRIQRALVALGHPLPISFANGGEPDGKFGDETFRAALAFQQKVFPKEPKQWDGRVGQFTLAKMDERLPKPPPPPPHRRPGPAKLKNRREAEQAIKDYLTRERRRNVVSLLVNHQANLIVFGEVHFTFDTRKAFLLSELIRPVRLRRPITTHFHASERFRNTASMRKSISDFLQATPLQQQRMMLGLPAELKTFLPVLVMASNFPNRRYGVLPINIRVPNEDPRDRPLFESFVDSAARCPDVPFGSINSSTSRGNILLGAWHAALRPEGTVCARLKDTGWKVHAVRLTVPHDPSITSPEDLKMVLMGSTDKSRIDVLQIAHTVAGGQPFYADLTKNDSPFGQLRDAARDAADIPYNQMFDALLHISANTVPFPVS